MSELTIVKTKPLKGDQYYPVEKTKNQIFLHHTAGTTAEGAIAWWNQTPEAVGTPYVIDRDGTIYECFDPDYYAYHMGVRGDNNHVEKHGIGIELVSAGHLYRLKGSEKLYFLPLYPKTLAKKEIPAEDRIKLPDSWRGYKHYHKYTDAQIKSVCALIEYLCKRYDIKVQDKSRQFFTYDESGEVLKGKGGIYSHTTVRKDKDDIFPQKNFLDALYKTFSKIRGDKKEPKVKEDKKEPKKTSKTTKTKKSKK